MTASRRETANPVEGLPSAAAEAADGAARDADELAALMDRVLTGQRPPSDSVLALVRDGLGGLHVAMTELATELQPGTENLP